MSSGGGQKCGGTTKVAEYERKKYSFVKLKLQQM